MKSRPGELCPKCGKPFLKRTTVYPDLFSAAKVNTKRIYYHTRPPKEAACVLDIGRTSHGPKV